MLTTKKSREEMFISTSTKPKAWVRPRAINQNVKSMTKNEIKELTDIIMKADVYSVFKGGRIDKSKKYSYLFRNDTGPRHYEFSIDADTVEEAKKSALDNFIAKFRAMEPKKNWSKKVLDEPGIKSQNRLIELKMMQIAKPFKKSKFSEGFWFVISPQGEYVMKTTMLSAIEYAESIGKKRKDVWAISV